MSSTAEGGSDGIVAKGPSNTYDGVNPCSSMDGNTDINFASVAPIDHDAPDYPDPRPAAKYALGSVPD